MYEYIFGQRIFNNLYVPNGGEGVYSNNGLNNPIGAGLAGLDMVAAFEGVNPVLTRALGRYLNGCLSEGAKGTADDIIAHGMEYADRVRARGVQDPKSHNFPYSFDDEILTTVQIPKDNGYNIFQKAGSMNDREGVFEIGVTKYGVIDHRFFRPN